MNTKWLKIVISALFALVVIQGYTFFHLISASAARFSVICKSFKTQTQAQHYYDTKQRGYKSLYVSKSGKVCTRLPIN